jgi:hypothetical protein
MEETYNIEIFTWHPNRKHKGLYQITEKDFNSKCCIYDCDIYWVASIPKNEYGAMMVGFPTFYDIYNYECSMYYENPKLRKRVMEHVLKKDPNHIINTDWKECLELKNRK